MKIGLYVRISTADKGQDPDLQKEVRAGKIMVEGR